MPSNPLLIPVTTRRQATGTTALHFAAQQSCADSIRLLLEYKANVRAKNSVNPRRGDERRAMLAPAAPQGPHPRLRDRLQLLAARDVTTVT